MTWNREIRELVEILIRQGVKNMKQLDDLTVALDRHDAEFATLKAELDTFANKLTEMSARLDASTKHVAEVRDAVKGVVPVVPAPA